MSDEILTSGDVRRAISDDDFADERGPSARDLRLLRQAERFGPRKGAETIAHREPSGPDLF